MSKNNIRDLDFDKLLVAPSILAADFASLGEEIQTIEKCGADLVHIDVMDGHFVPNITIGPPVVKSIRKTSKLVFDTHLMITNPLQYIRPFADAGADHITFHIECDDDTEETINLIRKCGCTVGISLKPKTEASAILPYLNESDLILVMTVEPGFGGQSFMYDMMPKVEQIRHYISESGRDIHLEVDGGIAEDTVEIAANAGANMMVAGTSVFRHPQGQKKAIEILHKANSKLSMRP